MSIVAMADILGTATIKAYFISFYPYVDAFHEVYQFYCVSHCVGHGDEHPVIHV
jgi:hypothetical protein